VRFLFLTHRYLGIAVSVLMVVWCLSGIVMMYVSYPSLPEARRIAALEPLSLRGCCAALGGAVPPDTAIAAARVEMLAGRAIADLTTAQGSRMIVSLASGEPIRGVSAREGAAVAAAFSAHLGLSAAISPATAVQWDQWTTSEQFDRDRPLYRFAFGDVQRSELYVSGVSGRAMQFTSRTVRLWNWLGAVPHWVYFSPLRRHAVYWQRLIIVCSLSGCFLTLTGLYIGVLQYLRRPTNRTSPYRGYMFWHHIPGLIFGLFLLTWVTSGLISVNPWGFLEGGGTSIERAEIAGNLPRWRELLGSLQRMQERTDVADLVSLRSAPLNGQLFFIGTRAGGERLRLNARGEPAPLSPLDWALYGRLLGAETSPQLMTTEDKFYFDHHSDPISLPVYRLVLDDAERTRYYLDPVSGEILMKFDRGARGYRWLHEGLHRLDVIPVLRARPAWDVLMAVLLIGASVVCVTGLYSAVLRVSGRRRTPIR
jgi:uncharacterized iron-regulated membrane protein